MYSHNLFASQNTFENMYDKYSALLMYVAQEISPSKEEAEEILFITFTKARHLKLDQKSNSIHCTALIKLLLQTAHKQLSPGTESNHLKLKLFEKTPMLHKILCNQINLESHCNTNNVTTKQVAKIIREEFTLLHTSKEKDLNTA